MMRVILTPPDEVKRLVSAIQRNNGDCEGWLNEYNKHPFDYTWYGYRMTVEVLHASYVAIGYAISYRGITVYVDNELNTIRFEGYE